MTDEDRRRQALEEAQEIWEEVSYIGTEKMACPECAGAGAISGGSLGNICPRCFGSRVVAHPGYEQIPQPPWAELKKNLPSMERIASLKQQGRRLARQISDSRMPLPSAVFRHDDRAGMLGDGFTDADFEEMEDEAQYDSAFGDQEPEQHAHRFAFWSAQEKAYVCECGDMLTDQALEAQSPYGSDMYRAQIANLRLLLLEMWDHANDTMLPVDLVQKVLLELAGVMPSHQLENARYHLSLRRDK